MQIMDMILRSLSLKYFMRFKSLQVKVSAFGSQTCLSTIPYTSTLASIVSKLASNMPWLRQHGVILLRINSNRISLSRPMCITGVTRWEKLTLILNESQT